MKHLPLQSPSLLYVEQSFKEWLDILGYARPTVYQMPNYIRELFYWLEQNKRITQVNQITTPLIKEYYQYLKHRANTRKGGALGNNYLNKQLQAIYKFMDYLRQLGRMELPYLDLRRETPDGRPIEILSVEEVKLLYRATQDYQRGQMSEAITARDRAMLSVFYGCGLRRNEGYHLDLSDVNFDRRVLHVRKGKNYKERFVPFNKTNSKFLQEYIYDYRPQFLNHKKTGALFISVMGRRMQTQSMVLRLKILQQYTDDIVLQQKEIALHTLRHSIATHLLEAGMSLENISRFLGHSSLESTQIYTHLIGKEDAQ